MKSRFLALPIVAFLCLCGSPASANGGNTPNASSFSQGTTLHLIENNGQVYNLEDNTPNLDVKFMLERPGGKLFLMADGISTQFEQMHFPEGYQELMREPHLDPSQRERLEALRQQVQLETWRVDMRLVGANAHAAITTEGKSEDYTQYYNRDVLFVHHYQKVTYHDIYPGIDWVIYTQEGGIKYDFVVHPGADPAQIRMQYTHQEGLELDGDGNLVVKTGMGELVEMAPVSVQEGREVFSNFAVENNEVHFWVGEYDQSKELVIDPVARLWGTYYGGANDDWLPRLALDNAGNVYMSGITSSTTAIAASGFRNTYAGGYNDGFLVKFNKSGVRQWGTYYGGPDGDRANDAATDTLGNIYIAGTTNSSVYIASGGFDNSFDGSTDAFLVKFNSAGVRLWGTYYGGPGYDEGWGVSTDPTGNVYLAGDTESTFGIASGGFKSSLSGNEDAFLVGFRASGSRLWGTYYGGTKFSGIDYDRGKSVFADNLGYVYLAGITNSDFEIASGGHDNSFNGVEDAFLVKFNASGGREWATYYGGSGDDQGYKVVADGLGNVFLCGSTSSGAGIALGGHQNSSGGGGDAFLVKFNSAGVRQWGTFYGGTGLDVTISAALDGSGSIYLAGWTNSASAIAYKGSRDTLWGTGDCFVAKFNDAGVRKWGTYIGGESIELYGSIVPLDTSSFYFSGNTGSLMGIFQSGHQSTYGGGFECFLSRYQACRVSSALSVTACGAYTLNGITYSASGTYTQELVAVSGCDSILTLNLTLLSATSSSLTASACDSYTLNGITYTSGGTHTQTLTNAAGCDSILTLNLTLLETTSTTTTSACETYTLNGITYTSSGTYTQVLTNTAGCDSTLTLVLSIHVPTTGSITATDCESHTLNGITYTSSGTYTQTLTNAAGCDSTLHLTLTILHESSHTLTASGCQSYTLNGITYTSSGTYAQTFTNAAGCDSTLHLNLIIASPPTTAVSLASGTLTAAAIGCYYQWVDCDAGFAPIPGATSQNYSPTLPGNYAVILTYGACTDTSACTNVTVVEAAVPNHQSLHLKVYPNPNAGEFTADWGKALPTAEVTLTDALGRKVWQSRCEQQERIQIRVVLAEGVYQLHVQSEGFAASQKVVIHR